MAILAQMPAPAPPQMAAGPDLLALLSGKSVEARVVASALQRLTQILIGRDLVKLNLPTLLPAGTPVTLRVVGSGVSSRLLVTPQLPASPAPAPATQLGAGATLPPPLLVEFSASGAPMAVGPAMPNPPLVSGTSTPIPAAYLGSPAPLAPQSALAAQEQGRVLPAGPGHTKPYRVSPAATSKSQAPFPTSLPASSVASSTLPSTFPPTRSESIGGVLAGVVALQSRLTDLPPPVAVVMRKVVDQQLNAGREKLSGQRLQQALLRAAFPAGPIEAESIVPAPSLRNMPSGEQLRTSLEQLRSNLARWLGQEGLAPIRPVQRQLVQPNVSAPRAQHILAPVVPEDAMIEEAGKRLLEKTDEALSQLRPNSANTADRVQRSDPAPLAHRAEWAGALPLMLGQEVGMLHFQISGDGGQDNVPEERSWQVRFALNFSVIGEVGAHVLMRGRRASVLIWAERDGTADALNEMLPELDAAFSAAGIESGSIQCRRGAPKPKPIAAGGFLDSIR